MGNYYSDVKNVRDRFTMRVDWDIDDSYHDGCHGTDVLFPDDPIAIHFSEFKNGEIVITMGPAISS